MQEPRRGRLRVDRHAHWSELGPPSGRPAELWVLLHGYGQRASRFLRRFDPLADGARRLVAPEGLSRFYLDERYERVGASWMTREDRELEIQDTVAWLDALVDHLVERDGPPPRTVVLGFSQGSPVAGRWLALGHVHAQRLVCWGAGLPHDLALDRHRETFDALHPLFVVGETDPLVPVERVEDELARLRDAGITHEVLRHPGGHEIDAATLSEVIRRVDAA